jgi:hypothetical protein
MASVASTHASGDEWREISPFMKRVYLLGGICGGAWFLSTIMRMRIYNSEVEGCAKDMPDACDACAYTACGYTSLGPNGSITDSPGFRDDADDGCAEIDDCASQRTPNLWVLIAALLAVFSIVALVVHGVYIRMPISKANGAAAAADVATLAEATNEATTPATPPVATDVANDSSAVANPLS